MGKKALKILLGVIIFIVIIILLEMYALNKNSNQPSKSTMERVK